MNGNETPCPNCEPCSICGRVEWPEDLLSACPNHNAEECFKHKQEHRDEQALDTRVNR